MVRPPNNIRELSSRYFYTYVTYKHTRIYIYIYIYIIINETVRKGREDGTGRALVGTRTTVRIDGRGILRTRTIFRNTRAARIRGCEWRC